MAGRGWRTTAAPATPRPSTTLGRRTPRGAGGDGEHGGLHEHDGALRGGEQLLEPAVEGEQALRAW